VTDWPVITLGQVGTWLSGGTPPREDEAHWSGEIPWLSSKDLHHYIVDDTAEHITVAASNVYSKVVPFDTVFVATRGMALAKRLPIAIGTREMAFNQDVKALRCSKVEPRFLVYAVRGHESGILALTEDSAHGTKRLETSRLKAFELPLPTIGEQRTIAMFLDRETQRIDALIEKKRVLWERLTERRLAVLLAAVDGRLTVGGPRRDRPLPWLGSLPVDWPTIKLSFVARLGSGHTPSRTHPEYWTDCTIPWITTGEVAQVRDDRREVITQTRERISELGLANSAAEAHPAGTVVLCRTASAGYSAIMGSDMATSQDFATWTCSPRLLPRFLLACLRAMRPDLLGRLSMGSTHKTIYMPDIQALRIPLPPVAEQQSALDAADRELKTIDALLDSLDTQIRLLHERRQALITEVVTGQRRVDAHPLVAA